MTRRRCMAVLTPLDIHNQEFRRVLRGYSEDEVDDFLDRVVADFEALLKENAQLKDEVEALRARVEQYRQLESTLHGALIVAQETAEEVKQNARKEAQLIVREAEEEAARRLAGSEARVRETQERLAQLQREAIAFRAQLRSQLESQLRLLADIPAAPAAAAAEGPRRAEANGPVPGLAAAAPPGETQVVSPQRAVAP
jgi:cell division initiation protein